MSFSNYFRVDLDLLIEDTAELAEIAKDLGRSVNSRTVGDVGAVAVTEDVAGTYAEYDEQVGTADSVFTLTLDATGGTFTLSYVRAPNDPAESGDIAFDATADEIAFALADIPEIGYNDNYSGVANVAVNEIAALTFGIQFIGLEANLDLDLTADDTDLTGGGSTATVVKVMDGGTSHLPE